MRSYAMGQSKAVDLKFYGGFGHIPKKPPAKTDYELKLKSEVNK